jgi:DNA-binding XRE family transcriptional regulator
MVRERGEVGDVVVRSFITHLPNMARSRLGYPANPRTVGEHLKRARLDRGIRQKEAARSIGCRPATLGTWEKGRVAPDVPFWPAILRFLGYDPRPDSM